MAFPALKTNNEKTDVLIYDEGLVKHVSVYLNSIANSNSRRTMKTGLKHFVGSYFPKLLSLDDAPWHQLSPEIVEHYRNAMTDDGYTFTTINNYLAALRGLTKSMWRKKALSTETYMRINSVENMKGTRLPKGRMISLKDQEALIAACQTDTSAAGIRDMAIISLALNCGLRRSEIISINYEDIVQSTNEIRIVGKGNKERLTPLNKTLLSIMDKYIDELRGTEKGALFTRIRKGDDITSERLSDQSVYFIFSNRCIEANIDNIAPHDCRRTVATTLLDKGAALSDVQMFLGHSDSKTTQRYDMAKHRQLHHTARLLEK